MNNEIITVSLLSNEGRGFAKDVEVEPNITIENFTHAHCGLDNGRPNEMTIRVNGQLASASQQLKDGDKVQITPKNIKGAIG